MFIKILLTIIFFAVMIGVGVYSRKTTKSVDGFVFGIGHTPVKPPAAAAFAPVVSVSDTIR